VVASSSSRNRMVGLRKQASGKLASSQAQTPLSKRLWGVAATELTWQGLGFESLPAHHFGYVSTDTTDTVLR
jgi:hypothetical protein